MDQILDIKRHFKSHFSNHSLLMDLSTRESSNTSTGSFNFTVKPLRAGLKRSDNFNWTPALVRTSSNPKMTFFMPETSPIKFWEEDAELIDAAFWALTKATTTVNDRAVTRNDFILAFDLVWFDFNVVWNLSRHWILMPIEEMSLAFIVNIKMADEWHQMRSAIVPCVVCKHWIRAAHEIAIQTMLFFIKLLSRYDILENNIQWATNGVG